MNMPMEDGLLANFPLELPPTSANLLTTHFGTLSTIMMQRRSFSELSSNLVSGLDLQIILTIVWDLLQKGRCLQLSASKFPPCPVLDREISVTFDAIVGFGQMKVEYLNVGNFQNGVGGVGEGGGGFRPI